MQKVTSSSETYARMPDLGDPLPTTELKVPQIALPPNLEGMVGNLRKAQFHLMTAVPGVHQNMDPDSAIHQIMNLILLTGPKATTQHTDPAVFFQQMGCDRPPASCTSEHLKGFYSLTDSCLLSDWINIRDFLDFDVFSSLKKIHQSSSSDLKRNMQEMMTEWCRIRAQATHDLSSGFLPYIKDASLFHRKLRSILTKKKIDSSGGGGMSAPVEYHFPKIVAKLERNYHFLMQFIGKEHGSFLTKICLSQLSGIHNMTPTKPTRSAEVLKNLQDYAEFMVESNILGHNSKLISTDPIILQNILSQIQTLANIKNPDKLADGCKNFRHECEKAAMHLTGQVFSFLGCQGSSYQKWMGNVSIDDFVAQIASLSNKTRAMQAKGLSTTVEFIYDLSFFVEYSILSVADPEYVLDESYRNRMDTVLISLNNEWVGFRKTENGLRKVSCAEQSSSDFFELEQFVDKSRIHFYKKLQNPNFLQRMSDYLDSAKPDSSFMLVHFCVKNFYETLKPLTEEAVQSLKKECSKYSPAHFSSTSLFEKTQWLAKVLLLVHDMGMLLKDPAVIQDIEFHPDYINLINQYDPSVLLQNGQNAPEEEDLSPDPEMCMHMPVEEDTTETKREPIALSLPLPPSPLLMDIPSSSSTSTTRPSLINTSAAATPSIPMLDRSELKDAIRRTQGDLRLMSRALRSLLGWSIEHNGERHPSIRDSRRRPIATVPNTGHAGLGTLLNIATSVCDAAQAQGLIRGS